ncbi:MAG: hypothetical protein AAGD23_02290 [Pseudomonadota bacterium]
MRRLALVFLFLLLPNLALADIVRGCRGTLFVGDLPDGSWSRTVDILELDASGRCSGVSTANNCRVLARLALLDCYAELWADRNKHDITSACETEINDSNRINWMRFLGLDQNLPGGPNSWIDRVRREACCNPSQTGEISVFIGWTSYGDTGCGGNTSPGGAINGGALKSPYTINCSRQRLRGICGSVPQRTSP